MEVGRPLGLGVVGIVIVVAVVTVIVLFVLVLVMVLDGSFGPPAGVGSYACAVSPAPVHRRVWADSNRTFKLPRHPCPP